MRAYKRQILVPFYFFVGGLAGGSFVMAVASHHAFGSRAHPLVLKAYALAFPLVLLSAVILTVDLTRPLRFWRLFTRIKPISPISIGSWALAAFGLLSALAWSKVFISALGPFVPSALVDLLERIPLAAIEGSGLPVALFVASYTGVLLNTSARPVWSSQPLLGGLFFASSLATSAALLGVWSSLDHTLTSGSLDKVRRIEGLLLAVQLLLTAGFVLMAVKRVGLGNARLRFLLLGRLSYWFHGSWIAGIVAPLTIWAVPMLRSEYPAAAFIAVLLGGMAMRYSVFLCEEPVVK